MRNGFLYTQVRAISARVNQNYDAWPSEELKKSFRTFLGKPVFVNHQNFDPEKARGRVVAARYRENGDDRYIEVIQEIDAVRFPKLAKEIHEGGLDSVSMGVEAGFTKCSVCDNTATDISDMCAHVKYHKGEKLAHVQTGEPTLVYENCLVAGTQVTMGDGTTRLIEDIQAGDLVLDHLGTPRTVLQTMSRQVNEDTFCVHRQNNQTQAPQMTGNHPVLAIRGAAFGKDTFTRQGRLDRGLRPEFIEARELQVGDWVCETHPSTDSSLVKILTTDYTRQDRQHNTCFSPIHTLPDTLELTEELGRFIGLFLAEGSVNKPLTQTDFAFHRGETHLADFVDGVARSVLGLASITHQERNGGRTVTIFSSPLAQMLSHFGIGAVNKTLPNEFMSAPVEFLRGVVTGHEEGDGLHGEKFVQKHGHKHFTCSPKLAEQIYTIHVMLGNTPYHSTRQVRPDYEYPGKSPASWLPMHTVGFGSVGQKKVGRLSFGPWTFVRINGINTIPYAGSVHNLEVADTHTYVAEGVAVHNCFKLGFFELSYVFDPADETAVVSRVVVANNKTAKPRVYVYPDKEKYPKYFVEKREEKKPEDKKKPEPKKPGFLERQTDKVLDELENDRKIRKVREQQRKFPMDDFLRAAGLDVDWADLGRQACEQGLSDSADDNPDFVEAAKSMTPEEVDFARSRYEQGYDMAAQRTAYRHASDTEFAPMAPTTGDMMGVPTAPTEYNLTPGAGWVNPDTNGIGTSGGSSGGGDGGGSGVGTSGGATPGDDNIVDTSRPIYDSLRQEFPDVTIGGYREPGDGFDEHANGALDVMTRDQGVADRAMEVAFQNGSPYVLWQQQQINAPWYNGGGTSQMEDRFSPTQNHMDHVHIAPVGWQGAKMPEGWTMSAMRRNAWGETEAPEDIDTLRDQSEDDGSDDFHHYVESPDELKTPDFDQAQRLDRAQESAGLDADRRVEDVEEVGIPTRQGGRAMPRYRYAEEMEDPSMGGADPALGGGAPPMEDPAMMGQPPMGAEGGSMGIEEELALLNQAQGDLEYAESAMYGGDPAMAGGGDPMADPAMAGGDPMAAMMGGGDPAAAAQPPVPPQVTARRLEQKYLSFCKKAGLDPTHPNSLAYFTQGGTGPVRNTASQEKVRKTQKGRSMGINLSERGKVASRGRRLHADESGHVDGGPYGRNDQGVQEEIFLSQTPAEEAPADPVGDKQISNTENTLVARVQRGTEQLRRDAAALAYLRQKAAARTAAEAEAIDPVPDANQYGVGVGIGDPMNSANVSDIAARNGLQQLGRRYVAMCRQAGVNPTQQGFRRFYAECCDDNIIEPTTVNPPLSGTDEQGLKGDDFTSVALDNVATQPKDASIHAFAAFDDWLARTTGKTARQHGNANFIRREAARYIKATGVPLGNLFPTLEKVLVEARKIEANREANMKRRANESLPVAAPGDRIDVEAPVSGVTDADAQASQYNLSDYGSNAGDGIADPDLSTDSQFWAPGGGEKTSNRTADAVAAVRCAEAYISAGLAPASEKWKLIARFQTMRHATVVDRTRLLEAKNDVDRSAASRQRSAAVSRGTSLPRGLGSGGQRTAQTNRIAASDTSSDSLLFFK